MNFNNRRPIQYLFVVYIIILRVNVSDQSRCNFIGSCQTVYFFIRPLKCYAILNIKGIIKNNENRSLYADRPSNITHVQRHVRNVRETQEFYHHSQVPSSEIENEINYSSLVVHRELR